jgi:precorrin-3B synthase
MSHALPIASPTAQRRGACPSLDAPMQTGDGLLARLRVANGRLTPVQLARLAGLAGQFGNGQVEITTRGNLQVRGLSAETAPLFARHVEAAVTIERGLVVEVPPLAGDDPAEVTDPRDLAQAIRALAQPLGSRLGPKVTVVVDGDGQIGLGALKADIRLTATGADCWLVSIGGGIATPMARDDALRTVAFVLRQLAERGPAARASDLPRGTANAPAEPAQPSAGIFARHHGTATGLALAFGATHWQALEALAEAGQRYGVAAFQLAPYHGLLAFDAPAVFAATAANLGFIIHPDDPRRSISACIGSEGCASGHIPARAIAARLATTLPRDTHLHVSGCAKGCAHPARAALTLVGYPVGCGLVIAGAAGDTPQALLEVDQVESAIAAALRQG